MYRFCFVFISKGVQQIPRDFGFRFLSNTSRCLELFQDQEHTRAKASCTHVLSICLCLPKKPRKYYRWY